MDFDIVAALRQLIYRNYRHVLVAGAYRLHALESQTTAGKQIKSELQDMVPKCSLYDNVTTPTKFRMENRPFILHLIFTNE